MTRSMAAAEQATPWSSAGHSRIIRSPLSGATYTIADNRSGSPDGADTVTGVENFQFSDGTRTASQLNPPPTTQNKIALENQKQGNPVSEWGIDGDGSGNIQGFATEISTNIGQTVSFKIATDSDQLPDRDLPARLLRRRRRAQGGDRRCEPRIRAGPAASDRRHVARPDRLRQLVGLGKLGHSFRHGLRRLHRQARPRGRHGRRQPHPLHRPR